MLRVPMLGFAVTVIVVTGNPTIVRSAIGNNPLLTIPAIPQLVDRLVAVVGTEPIFLSDVREVVRLQLLDPGGPLAPFAADAGTLPEQQALARMIDRRLVLAEAARYSQAAPAAPDLEKAERAWAARFLQP